MFKSTNSASLGVIIRDTNGTVISALSARVPLPQLDYRRAVQLGYPHMTETFAFMALVDGFFILALP